MMSDKVWGLKGLSGHAYTKKYVQRLSWRLMLSQVPTRSGPESQSRAFANNIHCEHSKPYPALLQPRSDIVRGHDHLLESIDDL